MHLYKRAFTLVFGLFVALAAQTLSTDVEAQLRVQVNEGVREPVPVAIARPSGASQGLADEIIRIVERNLSSSGLIRVVPASAHIETIASVDDTPRFPNWRSIDAQAVLVSRLDLRGGEAVLSFRLWDNFRERQLVGKSFTFSANDQRRAAHRLADEIYTAITGEGPYFDSRIVFTDERGDRRSRAKRIFMMDSDGENARAVTPPREFTLTPKISPDGRYLTYLSYRTGRPAAFIMDLQTNRTSLLGNFRGMSFSPSFAPNGREIALSMEVGGSTDIYVMDLSGNVVRRLTNERSIDTSPSYSPDGNRIVFTSDRSGTPQLYVMGANGGNATRITRGSGRYSSPEWSPRGDYIAFSRQSGGQFSLGVIRPDGSGERILHSDFMIDSPTWSPNGRVLLFAKEGRGDNATSALYSIDITGTNLRRLPTPAGASDPTWSRVTR